MSERQLLYLIDLVRDIHIAGKSKNPYVKLGVAVEKQLIVDTLDKLTEPRDTEFEIYQYLKETLGETYATIAFNILLD